MRNYNNRNSRNNNELYGNSSSSNSGGFNSKFFGNKTKDKSLDKRAGKQKFKSNTSFKTTSVRKTGRGK